MLRQHTTRHFPCQLFYQRKSFASVQNYRLVRVPYNGKENFLITPLLLCILCRADVSLVQRGNGISDR